MEAIGLIEAEGFNWGVIYVVTKLSLDQPREIFQFLANLAPRGSFMFNPVLIYSDRLAELRITPEEFVDFLGAILTLWWERRHELPQVQPFDSLAGNLLEENKLLMCGDSGECAYNHINLLSDGSLSHCGRSADWGLLDYGSIFDKSFVEVLADPQREELMRRNTVLPKTDCRACRFWDICHGGCPLDAWSASGSFLHKTGWCYAKRGFIEKYLEPLLRSETSPAAGGPPTPPQSARQAPAEPAPLPVADGEPAWINPIGGLGDTLMISGVLKQVAEQFPGRRFNLVARTKYPPFLKGHPAIAHIGHPPPGAGFISTNYWHHPEYELAGNRAYQVLARIFGLTTPVEERLYVPWELQDDPGLLETIPWKAKNILICQSSDSPRKQLGLARWEALVQRLLRAGLGVVQAGRLRDCYVRGAYSLLGLTTPRQLLSLLRHFDAVVTVDNFIMHAAHLCEVPAMVLWGPTDHRVYGYAGQIHLQAQRTCEYPDGCLGPENGQLYPTPCPQGTGHCLDTLDLAAIYNAVQTSLKKAARPGT
jgi:radical SAM protein with 4Fe4S-binding SPASM domain